MKYVQYRTMNAEFAVFASNNQSVQVENDLQRMAIPYRRLQGGYTMDDGTLVVEASWLVPYEDMPVLVDHWATQESVLLLSEALHKPTGCRLAELEFINTGERVHLGILRQVSRDVAEASPGWSHDPETGEYWTITEEAPTIA